MSAPQMTTAEALRSALASTIACSAQELQETVGQLVVATSAECPGAGPDVRSLSDPQTRTTVLLADRIPAGQEAAAVAREIERHHGRQAAQAVLGERAVELLDDGKSQEFPEIVSFRAECDHDVDLLLDALRANFKGAFTVRDRAVILIPDVKVELGMKSPLSIEAIKRTMRSIPDSYVMLQTLRATPLAENSLERLVQPEGANRQVNSRDPNMVYETGSDDTFWNSKVIRDGELFNVRVFDADGDRRPEREESFADQALAVAFADRSVLRLSADPADRYVRFKLDQSNRVKSLASDLGALPDSTHWDLVDEMKSALGASAANESTDSETDQESALSRAESWVTNNCSNGGIEDDVAMALWLRGMVEGESYLRSEKMDCSGPTP